MFDKLTMTQIRKLKNLDQETFGKPAGLDQQQVSRRENGQVPWKMEEIAEICKAFDVDTGVLALQP